MGWRRRMARSTLLVSVLLLATAPLPAGRMGSGRTR
jgi:hypothetical protein